VPEAELITPPHLDLGCDLVLHPFMHRSGMRHDVAVPLHLVPGAWGVMQHDVAVPLPLIMSGSLGCVTTLHPFVLHSGMRLDV
jgi:hypothetical protein